MVNWSYKKVIDSIIIKSMQIKTTTVFCPWDGQKENRVPLLRWWALQIETSPGGTYKDGPNNMMRKKKWATDSYRNCDNAMQGTVLFSD